MAEVILMPRLSDTMTEGVIAAWHKKVGDTVKKGELLAEIETDKATMELESYKEGVLLHIGAEKGEKLKVDDLLAIIGTPGEDISSYISSGRQTTANPKETTLKPAEESKESAASLPDITKMNEVVLMPRLSDTMTEGVIAAWHKKVGDPVKKGEILAEIETDKATIELESYKNGTLLYIGADKGEKIPVNGLLCIIGEKGKVDVDAIVAAAKGEMISSATTETKEKTMEPVIQQAPVAENEITNGRIKASPLAKRLAKERGIDLSKLKGSGDGGRIIKADIDRYVSVPAESQEAPAPAGSASVTPGVNLSWEEGYTDIPNSQMRNTIARRLSESKFSAPHFYLTMEINMDNAIAARAELNEISEVKISFNDMIVKAAALTLRKHPAVNASWMGDKIRRYHHVHIGVAVAIEEGLIVPVIRFADQKSLQQIATETKELAAKARNKKLQPHEFTGNTFTISNLGMMDIDEFTAIINPPDSCILAVGKIKETVVKKGEGFGVTNVMKVTLSCDHRSVDGATGAAFLQTLKKYIEHPITMIL
ncbi:MAG: pyruvate dehydrogenase complex dihydrolipoamide acetyltransferase [Chitinophagaceae bacterium]|nr:pyruvate dehydrogenase complex dihydrolipoamide acetyltransferase [Chitinophagaceae bacterium]